MSILQPSWNELSKAVRKALGIPESKEPLPDLKVEMEKPNSNTGMVLYKPAGMENIPPLEDLVANPPIGSWVSYRYSYNVLPRSFYSWPYSASIMGSDPEPVKEDSAPFETNMMEALVGWRAWRLDEEKKALRSQYSFFSDDEKHLLRPGSPMTAHCGKVESAGVPSVYDPAGVMPAIPDHAVPGEFCTCGIYAKDTLEEVIDSEYEGIYGQVYGWGRYVRGDQGWRAQYMYPKRFYLTRNYAREISPETIDFLKTYRVPIFVEQPCLFYNPEEDGYEYRDNEENWNFGADPEPDADEDYGS